MGLLILGQKKKQKTPILKIFVSLLFKNVQNHAVTYGY